MAEGEGVMPDGVITHDEVVANSIEAPVDLVTNWILIGMVSVFFSLFLFSLPVIKFCKSCAGVECLI